MSVKNNKNKNKPQDKPPLILLHIDKLNIKSGFIDIKKTSEENELPYKINMSYPDFKTSSEIKNNKTPAIVIIEGYFINEELIRKANIFPKSGILVDTVLKTFTSIKNLMTVYNYCVKKNLLKKYRNENEKNKNTNKSIKYILDILFKKNKLFKFEYPQTNIPRKIKGTKKYEKKLKGNKIIMKLPIYKYTWLNKPSTNYEILPSYANIGSDNKYEKGNTKNRKIKFFKLQINVQLFETKKISKNETRKLKCDNQKSVLENIIKDELGSDQLLHNFFLSVISGITPKLSKKEEDALNQLNIKKLLNGKFADSKGVEFIKEEEFIKKSILEDIRDIIKKYEKKVGSKDDEPSKTLNLSKSSSEFTKLSALKDSEEENIFNEYKNYLRKELLKIMKDYYSLNKNLKSKDFNEERYKLDSVSEIYPQYLKLLKKSEDKFYKYLKTELKQKEEIDTVRSRKFIKYILTLLKQKEKYQKKVEGSQDESENENEDESDDEN